MTALKQLPGPETTTRARPNWHGRPIFRFAAVSLLLLVVGALVCVAAAPALSGWRYVIVAGGSMEPALDFGSVAVIQPVQPDEIEIGDVIMFRHPTMPGRVVTHRVVGIDPEGRGLTTRGDANAQPDEGFVPLENVEGRFVFGVPAVGYLARWVGTLEGYLFFILLPGLALIMHELLAIARSVRLRLSQGDSE